MGQGQGQGNKGGQGQGMRGGGAGSQKPQSGGAPPPRSILRGNTATNAALVAPAGERLPHVLQQAHHSSGGGASTAPSPVVAATASSPHQQQSTVVGAAAHHRDPTAAPPPQGASPARAQRSKPPLPTAVATGGAAATQQPPTPSTAVDNGDAAAAAAQQQGRQPVFLRYNIPRVKTPGGRQPPPPRSVQVLLQCENWQRAIPLCPSEGEFYAVAYLPLGKQSFKFLVDGEETIDPSQPKDQSPATGQMTNYLDVENTDLMMRNGADADAANLDEDDADSGWCEDTPAFDESKKFPPMLPPHMRYTPLNRPPTQYRCDAEGQVNMAHESNSGPGGDNNDDNNDASAAAQFGVLDPEHLPNPFPVTINHVYFQRREDHFVVGCTTRHRNKFTSTVYYKPCSNQELKI